MTTARRVHTTWQVSAGPLDRSYVNQFIKYGVALVGPGDMGPWRPGRYDNRFIQRFASELQEGDVILLRTGASVIEAVGIVASEYQYLSQFDDVNGLDLQHGRRVRWCKLPDPQTFDEQVFGANPPRVSMVQSENLIDYANRFVLSPPMDWQSSMLPSLPPEEPALETPPPELLELIAHVHDLVDLYENHRSFGELPRESEMVVHYVVPLLRALGWPVEKIAVEWRNIDVSVFAQLPRAPKNCHYLIEAKRLGAGVEGALKQAVRYAKSLNEYCDVVVTDGIRYRMYGAHNNYTQLAYANLKRLKVSSLDLFRLMKKPQSEDLF